MLSPEQPDRIHVAFNDPRLVAGAGLILPVTLAPWEWVSWRIATLTWAVPLGEPTLATRC